MVGEQAERIPYSTTSSYPALTRVFVATSFVLFLVDQFGKGWAFASWRQPAVPREILPGLFVGAQGLNNGGMLSLEGSGSAAIVWTFTAIVFILLGIVLRWAIMLDRDRWRMIDAIAGGVLLAGILGNQIDRVVLGHVRDYMVAARYPYQIFNTADIFLVVGACILMGSLLTNRSRMSIGTATT